MKPRISAIIFPSRNQAGFSLIEMAVVLMIIGILMSGVLISISQTTLNARRAAALLQLQQVEEALYGFAESQGRLPCPANATGAEDCTLTHGFVPAATLGIYGQANDNGVLLDPWQNPLRYSVVKAFNAANPGNPDFTNYQTGMSSVRTFFSTGYPFDSSLMNNMLKVCATNDCTSGPALTKIAPAVIMTMGENWASYSTTNSSTSEITNAGSGTPLDGHPVHADSELTFVSTDYSEENFDDQLVWLSPYVLFNRMVSAGKLP